MKQYATSVPLCVVLDIPAGHIRLVAADRTDTTVEVLPTNAARSRDVKAAEQTTIDCADGILRIETPVKNQILGPSGSIEVTVHLPAGSRVEAKAASAELRGVGRLGYLTFDGAQATVRLDETAGTRVTLQAGDVTVGRLTGAAEISTHKGDLHITEAVHGTVTLTTESGDISVGAARTTSAALNAHSAHGRIDNALRTTDGAAAGLTLHATTGYGDITACSL